MTSGSSLPKAISCAAADRTIHRGIKHSANLRGILAMVAANAVLSANDACLKLASTALPTGELIFVRNGFATLLAVAVVLATGALRELPGLPAAADGWRTITDICGTLFFIAALVRMPFADAVAIHQFLPLAMTAPQPCSCASRSAGGAGWQRPIGLLGALLIVRPGSSAFTPASLLALCSVAGIAARDLITRHIPASASAPLLPIRRWPPCRSPACSSLPFESWRMPAGREFALLAASGVDAVLSVLCCWSSAPYAPER